MRLKNHVEDVKEVLDETLKSLEMTREEDVAIWIGAEKRNQELRDELTAANAKIAELLQNSESQTQTADALLKRCRELEAQNAVMRDALEELLNYKGGAENALEDDDLVYRSIEALSATPDEALEKNEEIMRRDFEKWVLEKDCFEVGVKRSPNGKYVSYHADAYWNVWKAARNAVVEVG